MKKVLSVLLAGAMIMGMSVSAFAAVSADKIFAANANDDLSNGVHACDLAFDSKMIVVHNENNMSHGDKHVEIVWTEEAYEGMKPGDNLYFPIVMEETVTTGSGLVWEMTNATKLAYERAVEEAEETAITALKNDAKAEFEAFAKVEVEELVAKATAKTTTLSPVEKVMATMEHYFWGHLSNGKKASTDDTLKSILSKELISVMVEMENKYEAAKKAYVADYVAENFEANSEVAKDFKAPNYTPVSAGEKAANAKDYTFVAVKAEVETDVEVYYYTGRIDKDWSINTIGNEYVSNGYFVAKTAANTYSTKAADLANRNYQKLVCVEIMDELDNLTAQDAIMYAYIADMDSDCKCPVCEAGHVARNCKSKDVYMNYTFGNETIKYVDFDFVNDADLTAKWVVAKNDKGTATFDFEDGAWFTVNMVSEEEVILNLSTAYDKAVDALFDYDADLAFFNFKGTKDSFIKTGKLFIEAAADTYIYEVVDGALVEVEAEYVTDYKVGNTATAKKGFVLETKELGYYVVSDIEAEIEEEVEEPATEPEVPAEPEKANPETGAADFVGAAVAMAVVSVAAAGALALKK